MAKITQEHILDTARVLFAQEGMTRFSIRLIAKELKIAPSLIYYYFKTEDDLLLSMFLHVNKQLGQERAKLPLTQNAKDMLKQRIEFQIDNLSSIVAVLKYYLKFRKDFPKFNDGFLPDKSSLHIEEVLEFGVKTGEFVTTDILGDSKVITHAINGYLLEFYPHPPSMLERRHIVEKIYSFVIRAIGKKTL